MSELLNRIDRLIEERHLLKHPFYQAWNAGELSIESLLEYSCQYYAQVKAFPLYLGAVYARIRWFNSICRKLLAYLRKVFAQQTIGESPSKWLYAACLL